MPSTRIPVETTAQAYLRLLHERGVEYFFGNAGTDFASIIDAFAWAAATGASVPTPITVPHEGPAVAMAYGYAMITGRPQAVMVHVNVGSANAMAGVINTARDRVPMLFTAGRTPLTESGLPGSRDLHIHWAQESFDQGAAVREYVKWDYELRNFHQLEDVVDRALEMATTPPFGPVYLTLPREVLAESHAELTVTSPPRRHTASRPYPDPESIGAAAELLAEAENPLIIATMAGRDPAVPAALEALAEAFAIPVVEFNHRAMCFPTAHPLHQGFDPHPFLDGADAIVVVESDVPWFPANRSGPPAGKVVHVGIDPYYSRYPMRSFPRDLALPGDVAVSLGLLAEALGPRRAGREAVIDARRARLATRHDEQRAAWAAAREAVRDDSPIDPRWLSHCIGRVKDDDTIVVNEYDLVPTEVEFSRPGTFFGSSSASGLGWGLGAALGAKLAAPERLVIATFGDGAYMFNNPTPCHFVSRAQGLPILAVVFNNSSWGAVASSNRMVHPEGWASRANRMPLADLEPSPDFELLAVANGGYGERVEEASEVMPALERALHAVRVEKRQALLNVVCRRS